MKIAYVINSMEGGGAALPIPAVAGVLRRCGADVRVLALTRRDGRAAQPIEESGLELRIREGGEKDHLAALRWLSCELIDFAPDIVWTSLTRATLGQVAAKRLRVPVVSWQHNAYLKPGCERIAGVSQITGIPVLNRHSAGGINKKLRKTAPVHAIALPQSSDMESPRAQMILSSGFSRNEGMHDGLLWHSRDRLNRQLGATDSIKLLRPSLDSARLL